MAIETKYSVKNLRVEFPNDDACLEHLFDTLHSRKCSCGGTYARISGRKQFQCSMCRFQIAPMVGTIFQKTSTPLTLWFHAIFIFSNAKSGISAKEMERHLGVTYKTAWRFLHLIRASLKQSEKKLKGTVEADESSHGGKGGGGTYNKNQKRVMASKVKVVTAIERGGETRSQVIPNTTRPVLQRVIRRTVEEGSSLFTDGSPSYPEQGFHRERVWHGIKQWTKELPSGEIAHINSVESFNAHVKRSIRGVFKSVSRKHFQSYLDAFVWHRNNRHNDRERFSSLLSAIVG